MAEAILQMYSVIQQACHLVEDDAKSPYHINLS